MKVTCTVFLVLSSFLSFSQKIGSHAPSFKDTINAGLVLHDSARYEQAIEKYNKVPLGDSAYELARYEKALSYFSQKKYKETIRLNKEAIDERDDFSRDHYLLMGNSYDLIEQPDSSLFAYNQGLKEFPFYFRFYHEMAIFHKRRRNDAKAFENLKNSLLLNPFHAGTHKVIGVYAAQANHYALALMALQFASMLETNSDKMFGTIGLMEKIADGEYKADTILSPAIFNQPEELEELDQIVNSRVANTEAYKGVTKLNFRILKQIQIVCEKLPKDLKTNNFFIKYYADFYKMVWDKKLFEGMAIYLLRDLNTDQVQKEFKKKKTAIDAYKTAAIEFLSESRKKGNEPQDAKYKDKTFYFEGQVIEAIGKTIDNKKTGEWTVFGSNGRILGEGRFENNLQEGTWNFYHNNRTISKSVLYKNGEPDGKYSIYYESGLLREEGNYSKGKLEGNTKSYYQNGAVKEEYVFKKDLTDGKASSYDDAGYKLVEYNNTAGKLQGPFKRFDPQGKLAAEGSYITDKLSGPFTTYFPDGTKESEVNYIDGKANGKYFKNFSSGKPLKQGEYKNDLKTGNWKEFHNNGKLYSDENYKDDKQTGINKYYDSDGVLIAEYNYSANNIQSYKFLDKTGKVIAENKAKGNKILLVRYNAIGVKASEGNMDNGNYEGAYKEFHPSGKTDMEVNMKADKKQGIQKHYYKNGKILSEYNFDKGQLQGYGKNYFRNGKVQAEGCYLDDEKHGIWKYYHANGMLDSEEHYVRGKLNGFDIEYLVNGKLLSKMYYDNGFMKYVINYDSSGKVIKMVIFKLDATEYAESHIQGKPLTKFIYKYAHLSGRQLLTYSNGKTKSEMTYKYGKLEGIRKSYYENGKLLSAGKYVNHKKDSVWVYYDEDGKKEKIETLEKGGLEGKMIYYYPNGNVELERVYVNDERSGESISYAQDGTVKVKTSYYKGIIIGYTYMGKDGNYLPLIQVVNTSVKMKALYPNGNTSAEWEMKDGYYEGDYKEYYTNGKLFEAGKYRNGEKEGVQKTFYPDGILKSEYSCNSDEYHGDYVEYHENGKIKSQRKFYMGLLHGKSTTYDKEGKLISAKTYYMDNAY